MAAPEIQHWNLKVLTIANALVNLKGIVTDISAPKLTRDFDTTKRAGEAGVVARPKFFTEVEMSFTIKRVTIEALKALTESVSLPVTLQCSTIQEKDDGSREVYLWNVKGFPSEVPLGDLSEDGLESEITIMAHYVSASLGTYSLVYDPVNYIYSVNGTNLYDGIKTDLGL